MRFEGEPPTLAEGVRYIELRRNGIRFENSHGVRAISYEDIEATVVLPSGKVELRFKGRDMFGRPNHQTLRLAVHHREASSLNWRPGSRL